MVCTMIGSSCFKLLSVRREMLYKIPLYLHGTAFFATTAGFLAGFAAGFGAAGFLAGAAGFFLAEVDAVFFFAGAIQ